MLIHEDAGTHEARIHLRRGTTDWEIVNKESLDIEVEDTTVLSISSSGTFNFQDEDCINIAKLSVGSTNTQFISVFDLNPAPTSFTNAAGDFVMMFKNEGINGLGVAVADDDVFRLVLNNSHDLAITNGTSQLMRVNGDGEISIQGKLAHLTDADTFINFTPDNINFQAGGVDFLDITEGVADAVIFKTNVSFGGSIGNVRFDTSGDLIVGSYTDATRPAAGTAGRIIFNTDDGAINVDDGTNWTDAQGTTT